MAKTVERVVVTHRLARRLRERPDHPATNLEEVTAAVGGVDRILFLCWGNVCRSPLAEGYLAGRLEATGIDDVSVQSAGLGAVADRPSPETAVEAAAAYDVDIADHRSKLACTAQVEASDVVFVMDYYNYYLLVTRYPEAAGRTFFLGALLGDEASTTIPDPHGKGREAFDDAYAAIVDSVDRLVESLSEPSGAE